jgi:hypothetical protein
MKTTLAHVIKVTKKGADNNEVSFMTPLFKGGVIYKVDQPVYGTIEHSLLFAYFHYKDAMSFIYNNDPLRFETTHLWYAQAEILLSDMWTGTYWGSNYQAYWEYAFAHKYRPRESERPETIAMCKWIKLLKQIPWGLGSKSICIRCYKLPIKEDQLCEECLKEVEQQGKDAVDKAQTEEQLRHGG